MSLDQFTWQCTRCQAKRYHQPNKLPDGWVWVDIVTVTPEKRIPCRYEARCPRCKPKSKPT